ncbi:YfjI family protein [Acidobacteria bacterium AH-259-G07]|nr:YfjI family protein [Acidobacteria bacterium AH-259-G07]
MTVEFMRKEYEAKAASAAAPPEHLPADLQKHLKASGWSIPHKGFLKDYLSWAVPRTEAPLGFHLASALTVAGAVLGRKCQIQPGGLPLYPNIYAVCVGTSTRVRKSYAISMVKQILQRVKPEPEVIIVEGLRFVKAKSSYFLADDGTPQGLLRELRNKHSGIKVFQEFGNFLQQTKQKDYMGGFAGLLTELYDCPPSFSKQLAKQEDSFTIEEPFLCILGATTREWLLAGIDETDIRGGFLPRFLLFPGEKTSPIPITPPPDERVEEQLARQLTELSKISGIFGPTEEAKQVYTDWYLRNYTEPEKPGMDLLSAYWGRLESYVWKIAFIFEATADPDLESISADSVRLAISFVERLKKNLKPLIQNELQPNPLAKLLERVRRMIHKAGPSGIARKYLLKNSHLTSRHLDIVIKTLEETEEIVEEQEQSGKRVYKAKEFAGSQGVRNGFCEV